MKAAAAGVTARRLTTRPYFCRNRVCSELPPERVMTLNFQLLTPLQTCCLHRLPVDFLLHESDYSVVRSLISANSLFDLLSF